MNYLLWAYAVTLVVLGLAAWRLRTGLAGAEADLAALGPGSDGPSGADSGLPTAIRSGEDAEHPSST